MYKHVDLHPGNIICCELPSLNTATDQSHNIFTRTLISIRNILSGNASRNNNSHNTENNLQNDLQNNTTAHIAPPRYRLILIDAGLTASLAPKNRVNFLSVFYAVITNHGEKVGDLMIEKSATHSCTNPTAFRETLRQLVAQVHKEGLSLKNVMIGDLLQRLLIACYVYQVKLEAKFVSLILALGI
jgi:aarF domain-containing kinase